MKAHGRFLSNHIEQRIIFIVIIICLFVLFQVWRTQPGGKEADSIVQSQVWAELYLYRSSWFILPQVSWGQTLGFRVKQIKMPALKIQPLGFLCLALLLPSDIFAVDFRSWRWAATPNTRLSDHVNETKMAVSILSCLSLCGTMPGCRTVNYREQDGACEMNTADARWSGIASPDPDPNFSYYEKLIPAGPQVCWTSVLFVRIKWVSTSVDKCYVLLTLFKTPCPNLKQNAPTEFCKEINLLKRFWKMVRESKCIGQFSLSLSVWGVMRV